MPLRDVPIKPLGYGEYQYNPAIGTAKDDTVTTMRDLDRDLSELANRIDNYMRIVSVLGYYGSGLARIRDEVSYDRVITANIANDLNTRVNQVKNEVDFANYRMLAEMNEATSSIENDVPKPRRM